ncbi:ATP-binding cassette domain-containing protein, partial [Anaerotruncus colihominis]|uniref:ATP-binding cassette domain-containing protein n=1 Tax=Anaerotruncus colihominis TaxID=169435 RepID=UPI00210C89EB
GVFLDVSLRDNISSVSQRHRAKGGFINFPEERRISAEYLKKLRIKTPSDQEFVRYLSGGNQQKVVLAKCLAEKSRILILDEPTRGIDVNAKAEIYKLIWEYIREGGSVVMVSSELPEVVGI